MESGLPGNNVYALEQTQDGYLWIGTKKGLNRLELKKETKEADPLTTVLTGRQGLLNELVVCLLEDPDGYLWIGTGGGLHRFKDGRLTTFTRGDGLSDSRIECLLADRRGNTWVGTANGLNRFNAAEGRFTVFTRKEGLSSNFIASIFEDSRGQLWIGTDSGLNCLKDGIITARQPGPLMENSLFRCAHEDKEGTLWFGTDSGLIRFRENQSFLYTVRCGLLENDVRSILEDERGYIWLAGRNGISRVNKKELEDFSRGIIPRVRPDFYNENDGMKSRWCNGLGCKTRDGRFWFPTTVGVAMIDPNHIKEDTISPITIIEKVMVDGVSIETQAKGGKRLELGPGKKWLGFNYRGLSFINPQRIQFKVRLAGQNGNWVEMENARSTTYTDLPPGIYTFSVTSRSPGGTWDQKGASFSFYMKPYFYQTTWFYVLAVLSVLFLGFLVYRLRVRQLKAREKELTQLVELRTRDLKERTVELEKAHDKLRESTEIIEEKNRHIMGSMRYARKIQQAMLPMKKKMEKELKEYFVIYKPKDIVSGDFYWFDVIDGHYFLAAADCTGHGVPGALLSMIGFMMLNEVVNERRVLEPASILARLHQGFRYMLKQEIGEIDTYDGMDVGLCRMDLDRGKILFAGAHRPLFYVKNSELIEIKGDRKSIGGRQKEEKHTFTTHEIDILDKDQDDIMLYLTTDGFADQHNPNNRKFGSPRLKRFLRENAHLSAEKQQQVISEELKKHRDNEEQRDDITLIGMRIRQ